MEWGSGRRKAGNYTGQHKHGINAYRHPCLEWHCNPRYQCQSGRRHLMPETAPPFYLTTLSLSQTIQRRMLERLMTDLFPKDAEGSSCDQNSFGETAPQTGKGKHAMTTYGGLEV
jgi:hypothetical protein